MGEGVKKVLIALSDRDDLASYGQCLSEKGFEPLLFGDESEAADAVFKENLAVIITEVSPKSLYASAKALDGERIFNSARNNPRTKNIPFIFIVEDVANIRGFRKEVDSLFIKPINRDELFARVKQCIAGKDMRFGGGKGIEGRLSQMSLADILQVLHMNRKEGVLKIIFEDRKGLIYIKDGDIFNASIGEIEKEKALFRLLQWKEGRFEFEPKTIDIPPKIQSSVDNLLMEGMRQYDELQRSKDKFLKPDAVLKIKIDLSILPKGLKPVIYEVLFLIESNPRVEDVVNLCSFPDYEVCQTIDDLIKKDIVEEVAAETAAAGMKVQQELISPEESLEVRKKIASDHAKIMLLYSDKGLVQFFIDSCKELPHFKTDAQFASSASHREFPMGEVGAFKIHGGTDIFFFALPVSRNIIPLLNTFSADAIGSILIVISDEKSLDAGTAARDCLDFVINRMPAASVFVASDGMDVGKEQEFKKKLDIAPDVPVFMFNHNNIETFSIVKVLFKNWLK